MATVSDGVVVHDHSTHHGICWSGVIAGAFAIAALGLILMLLGFGLGLSSVSPWFYRGVSGKTIAEGAIAWLVFSQVVASGLGGFLAGRLRHRWGRIHADEIHFRDTSQGFLAWAVAIVISAAFLTSAATSLNMSEAGTSPMVYSNHHMSAPFNNSAVAAAAATSPEAMPQGSEEQTIEANRKAVTYASLWLFIALLAGAFSASIFGVLGGHQRDTLFPYVDRTLP